MNIKVKSKKINKYKKIEDLIKQAFNKTAEKVKQDLENKMPNSKAINL